MTKSWAEAADNLSTENTDGTLPTDHPKPTPPRRRWWVWLCALLVLLLLALTPPMLNVNRLQRRIAESISRSLGRPVHLDSVTLHLLPMPGFSLQNLVVSEDPAFGAEPTIRAATVNVTLRPGSLWRRHVEFSTISFESPSVNLVRNAQGQWNLQSLLMHAAQVNSAPTAQRRAGPEPRFPYIEANGARVNLKIGEEKTPFSLTDADFALWLSSPQQWQVRIQGRPNRTDRNISDPGAIKLEGSLRRAAAIAQVPIDLTLNWEGAPLGEASILLGGADAGWRGNLSVATSLSGTLSAARLNTTIHLEDLRRADFVPVETLDVQAACGGTLDITLAVLRQPNCSVVTPQANGAHAAGTVMLTADRVEVTTAGARSFPSLDLSHFSNLRIAFSEVPNTWLLDWARLFSQRILPAEAPGGSLTGSLLFAGAQPGASSKVRGRSSRTQQHTRQTAKQGSLEGGWQGSLQDEIFGVLPWKGATSGQAVHPAFLTAGADSTTGAAELILAPLPLTPPGKTPPLLLSGTASRAGYRLTLTGIATGAQLAALRALAPPLGDGLQQVLNTPSGRGVTPATQSFKVDVTCERPWSGVQTCSASKPGAARRRRRRR